MSNLFQAIEWTLLSPKTNAHDVETLCHKADEKSVFGVCVPPRFVSTAKKVLSHGTTTLITVVGFPLGHTPKRSKLLEANLAFAEGAQEIDMVLNLGYLKDLDALNAISEINEVKRAFQGQTVKVIVESGLLSPDELKTATEWVSASEADFIKTCTGFTTGAASPGVVKDLKKWARPTLAVKASGGVRTYQQCLDLMMAGASRIGTSSAEQILAEALSESVFQKSDRNGS